MTQIVDAGEFHPMRGHVRDGIQINFADGTTGELQSTMNGWIIRQGEHTHGPYSGWAIITSAVLDLQKKAVERCQP